VIAVADTTAPPAAAASPTLLLLLFGVAGATGLVFEVLWVRELSTLVGSAAGATAVTVAAFFVGTALGQHLAGCRAARLRHPLRGYALCEAGVAAGGLWALGTLAALRAAGVGVVPGTAGDALRPMLGASAVATLVVLPGALCIGAGLPLLGQYVLRGPVGFARLGSTLYAVNTLGAALGAVAAGFWLPTALGIRGTMLAASAVSAGCAAVAWGLAGWRGAATGFPQPAATAVPTDPASAAATPAMALALASGLLALALEVLWVRMFALVLQSSVYAVAVVLAVYLAAIAAGGLLARAAASRGGSPAPFLAAILCVTGVTVGLTPFGLWALSGGFGELPWGRSFSTYVGGVVALVGGVLFVPALGVGTVFPTLLRVVAVRPGEAGAVIGRLAAANTLGGVVGALGAGFVVLPTIGLWAGIRAAAVGYVALAVCGIELTGRGRVWLRVAGGGALLLLVTLLDPARLPAARVAATHHGESLFDVRESAYGTLAVVGRGEERLLRLDNWYTLGGTATVANDRRQAHLPLFVHAAPRDVFFLGLGAGVTANAALRHPVESVTTAELLPDVVDTVRQYFGRVSGELFTDPRSRVVVADGRRLLAESRQAYDVIVSDLFIPWQAGTGSLYTSEHFRTVRERLAPGGLFAQWLPLYQLSRREFDIIASTLLETFPLVTLWRGDFSATEPIAALIGHRDAPPLDPAALAANVRALPDSAATSAEIARGVTLLFYVGNLTAAADLFAGVPRNTDDRPLIEYLAPLTERAVRAGTATWLTEEAWLGLAGQVAAAAPADRDPYLSRVSSEERQVVEAGRRLHETFVHWKGGRHEAALAALDAFRDGVPFDLYRVFKPQLAGLLDVEAENPL